MSKKRWLASFFALALSTQIAWAQTVEDDVVPGEDLPFAPADSIPPPARQTTETDPNWLQTLVDQCLKNVVQGWSQGTCPNCPVVKTITIDPFGNAARHIRMVVQYSTNGPKGCTGQCPLSPPPVACQVYGTPPCEMGNRAVFGAFRPECFDPSCFNPAQPAGFGLPVQVNPGCCKTNADKPGCCNGSCKCCGKAGMNVEAPWGMQMPPFAPNCQMPGYVMGPVIQHVPFAHPCMHPWMAQQQWMQPPMMPPAWGQNADWATLPAPQWLEWNHPVVWTRLEEPTQAVYQVVAKGDAVYLNTPNMEAKCQRMTYVGTRDRVLLEGNVRLVCKKGTDVTRIEAPQIMVDLLQGTFTVEAGKGCGPVSTSPCCPAPCCTTPCCPNGACPVPPIGPISTWGEFWERMCGYGQEIDMPREMPQRNPPCPRSDR